MHPVVECRVEFSYFSPDRLTDRTMLEGAGKSNEGKPMPLIKVQTNAEHPTPETTGQLLSELSAMLADALGKSEAYVMTLLEPPCSMTFGGSDEPTCYMEVKNIGTMTAEQSQRITEMACTCAEKHLGIAPSRIYIEFNDAQRHLWGWNGNTFA